MPPIRSVLWIGSARGLEESPVAGAPSVDLAWAPDLDTALDLPLAAFDVVVMDAPAAPAEAADDARTRLARAGARDVLVTADPAHFPALVDLDAGRCPAPPPKPEERCEKPPAAIAGVIGTSAAMRQALALVARAQRTSATVLLTGETGTGKEVLARAVHAGSPRARAPFVAVNCAAFPDTLLESELFGHVRGAFTGADRGKPGLFEAAHGGSLFLDEVGETSLPLQAKLLRVLQEGEVRAVGGTRSRRVDVRVIAATNRELRREIQARRFREDLYYRLAVFPIRVPPLRERRQDVMPLAQHFLALHGRREGKRGCHLTPEATDLLRDHAWPGNVRELENEMLRALALSEPGGLLGPEHLSERVTRALEPVRELAAEDGETLRATMARIEAWLLRRALAAHGGRRAETARRLGITREGLYKKLKKLGID
jgi:transcriptional regulator with PAS, ATPase and Fis domain